MSTSGGSRKYIYVSWCDLPIVFVEGWEGGMGWGGAGVTTTFFSGPVPVNFHRGPPLGFELFVSFEHIKFGDHRGKLA